MKKILSIVLATAMAATLFVMPSYAESTFSTAKDFISDVIDLSITGVESQTLDTAKETVMNKITVSGDEVFYDGTSIGFWYSDNSSVLYADESKSSTVISPDVEGYVVSPSLLHDMLYDLNDKLEDNYVPSSSDWSKIIGKYDVKLGNITIPADQWVTVEPDSDPLASNKLVNMTALTGIGHGSGGTIFVSNNIYAMSWAIDANGVLYIQNQLMALQAPASNNNKYIVACTVLDQVSSQNTFPDSYSQNIPLIKMGIINNGAELTLRIYGVNSTHSLTAYTDGYAGFSSTRSQLLKVDEPSVKNTSNITDMKKCGIAYFLCNQAPTINGYNNFVSEHIKMFESCSTSKLVKGNQKLTRRINALSTLLPTDTVTVKADGWTINGHDSIDSYITDQGLNVAGDTANIAALADIDALEFYVVVPTSLPVYVDAKNVTYVADNADITNKSGASVQFTDVTIVPKDDTGWTMVDANPTVVVGGNEFTFDTTIEKDKVLQPEEVYPFEYHAKLSPTTEASSSLELATVLVTVDWAQ